MWRTPLLIFFAACVAFGAPGLARAQILPGAPLSGLRDGLRDIVPAVPSTLNGLTEGTVAEVLRAPRRLNGLIRRSNGALVADPQGWPVVSGEVVAVDMSPIARRRALSEGFTVAREERLAALDLTSIILSPPR